MNFAWKQWKLGLMISLFTGLLTAGTQFSLDAKPKVIVASLIINMAASGLAYLQRHPVEAEDNGKPVTT